MLMAEQDYPVGVESFAPGGLKTQPGDRDRLIENADYGGSINWSKRIGIVCRRKFAGRPA
jgi:hypothetical protein